MDEWTGRRRTLSLFAEQLPDRLPVFASTLAGAAWMLGVPQNRFHQDPHVLARCVVEASRALGLDGVYVSSDNWIMHEALGGKVRFPDDDEPWGTGTLLNHWEDLERLQVPDPEKHGRMPMMLAAVREAVRLAGDDLYIEANVDSGPFQLALTLRGAQQALLDIHDEPEKFAALMRFCTQVTVAYARAMARAGVDGVQFGESSASLVSARVFREFILPCDQEVISALHSEGVHAFLHVCGNSRHLLDLMAESRADCLEIDALVDLTEAFDRLGSRCVIRGNVDTMLLLNGPPERIRQAGGLCLAKAGQSKGRLILSPGCGVPKFTPADHVRALVEASQSAANRS